MQPQISSITYEKASELSEDNRHVFKIFNNKGEVACKAKLEYISIPCRMFILKWLGLEPDVETGDGYGTKMIQQINDFLSSKKIPGVLFSLNSALGFYEKNGWKRYRSTNIYFFGDISEEEKETAINKIHFRLKHI